MRFHPTALAFVFALGALALVPRSGSAFVPPWAIDPESAEADARAVSTVLPPEDESQAANRDQFDVLHYEIFLAPDFDTESLTAAVTVSLQAVEDDVDFVDLDLSSMLAVDRVRSSGTDLPFDHADDVLRLFPPQLLDEGDTWTATIYYGGQPEPTGFLGFSFGSTPAGDPLLATLSQPYGARSWWPCKDTPGDKATVLLRALVPTGLYVASNGVLEAEIPSGANTLFEWRHDYPISTYNVSIAVADYVSWEETWRSPGGRVLPIEYHVFPEHEEAARFDFARTTDILDYYSELFGEYPFVDEKYGMAEFVWEGAMEHQTMTSYGDFFLTGDRFYERIIGHELAHHWWGNSMTLEDWGELWVHEGFATLAEGLWVERAEGTAAYRTFLRRRSNGCCGFFGPISPPNRLFNQTVFNKAAWMLHMLRGFLGDTTFFSAVYDLAQRPELQYGSIVTEDVVEQFETSTGQPLQWFFDQWLYRIGRPTFTVEWTTKSVGDRTRLRVEIDQSDLDDPWMFPLQLRAVTPSGPVDLDTFVASDKHQFTAFVDGDVEDVLVDPDEWLLKFVVETATDAPAPVGPAARLLPNAPNPFNPRTALRFELPTPQDVRLRILDARGRVVDVLEPGPMPAGRHRMPWTGVDRRGNPVASGTYRVLLEADGTVSSVRPITLVR